MKKNFVKTFSTVFIITLISKILGLLRDIVFAKYYGTGYIATAYFAAIRIPTQLLDIGLSAAITSTFIPVFNEILQKDGKDNANRFAGNFINIIAVIATIISVIGIIFSEQFVNLLAGGFEEQTFNLTVDLIKITFPMIIFTAIAFSFVGFLQSYGQFNIPAMISAISNLALIIYLILFRESFGIYGVTTFMLVAWALQVLIQLPSAYKNGYRFKFKINLKDENIKKVFKLAIPIIFSTSVLSVNNLVATRLASNMGDSAVAALEYSYKLYLVIVGVFSYAIGNIIFPELARSSLEQDNTKYINIIQKGVRILSYLLIPLTIGIMIYKTDLVSVIYQSGEFNETSTLLTSGALLFYSLGMLGFGIVEVMNKAFYAKKDAKTPMLIGIGVIIVNVGLSFVLSKLMLFNGLALSTAITSTLNAFILLTCANIKEKGIINKGLVLNLFKILISAGAMCVIVILINNNLINIINGNKLMQIIRVCIGAFAGVIVYYLATLILKVDEALIPVVYIKNRKNTVNE